jgi:hypothetical protein
VPDPDRHGAQQLLAAAKAQQQQPETAAAAEGAGAAALSPPSAESTASVLVSIAAVAGRLSDVDLLSCPVDATLPVSGPCVRAHRDCMLLMQQPQPARNTLVLAGATDWGLQQERAQAYVHPWQQLWQQHARQQQQGQQAADAAAPAGSAAALAGGLCELSGCVDGRSSCSGGCAAASPAAAAALAAWAAQLAVRGEDGTFLQSVLGEAEQDLSSGLFGRESLDSSSYTSDSSVAQAVAEVLLQQQLLGVLDGSDPAVGAACACAHQQHQYPRHRLASLANALLLAGPAPYCLAGGAAAAADRLSSLGAMCRAEAARQGSTAAAAGGRASRRGAVFEHYLNRRLHNLAQQPELLHELQGLVRAAG